MHIERIETSLIIRHLRDTCIKNFFLYIFSGSDCYRNNYVIGMAEKFFLFNVFPFFPCLSSSEDYLLNQLIIAPPSLKSTPQPDHLGPRGLPKLVW